MTHLSVYETVRPLVSRVLPSVTDPVDVEMVARYAMGVGWLETNYAQGWKGAGKGSNNMGAVTGTFQGKYFTHGDSNPSGSYVTKFKVYPTAEAGWTDLLRIMYRSPDTLRAALAGDTRGVSQCMYDAHYYTGTSKTPSVNVDRHEEALTNGLRVAESELGPLPREPNPLSSGATGATLAVLLGLGFLAYRRVRGRK
jgi:hypothetical protein